MTSLGCHAKGPSSNSRDLEAACWEVLTHRYTEDHRYYHNLTHLQDLFSLLDQGCLWYSQQQNVLEKKMQVKISPAVTLAALFHDVIYDPQRQDNEEASAAIAAELLEAGAQVPTDVIHEVTMLILATKSHQLPQTDTPADEQQQLQEKQAGVVSAGMTLLARQGSDGHLNKHQQVKAVSSQPTDPIASAGLGQCVDSRSEGKSTDQAEGCSMETQTCEATGDLPTAGRRQPSSTSTSAAFHVSAEEGCSVILSGRPAWELLMDADLGVLAATREQYMRYSQAIRREYSHLSEENFRSGRIMALQSLLSRNQIFISSWARANAMEERARSNMEAEINVLQDRASPPLQSQMQILHQT
ncbi:hypothetical protein CEUSTIGMA_g63.t1 [Chlamydomonas eustigma]|uniref:PDEase domain-containing protein n=1 Tax=Chlamydomonas eustigma TaxID=1157962 RepID=A0A250WP48_9CHLO|nr:hypothetical protein CEUSTIGMA_g63.t1 [Chlamydomonas eustigma]|eukprot:GAX72607.1 hypothetical protein CEUSTIGMA_g63.t1 [Chlamydomonas eustigma]